MPRSTWYELRPDIRPKTATINGLVYVLESPEDWFARIAEMQRVEIKPKRRRRPSISQRGIADPSNTEPTAIAAAGVEPPN